VSELYAFWKSIKEAVTVVRNTCDSWVLCCVHCCRLLLSCHVGLCVINVTGIYYYLLMCVRLQSWTADDVRWKHEVAC